MRSSSLAFAGALALGTLAFVRPVQAGQGEIELILDCSGSMTDTVEGRPKIQIAKQCVNELIESLPEGQRVGLRAYGHHAFFAKVTSCADTELLVPIGPANK